MTRSHNHEYFYKFMSANTAISIFNTSTLRYTSPNLFNDPFDHQVSFNFPFSKEEFSDALLNECKRIIYDDTVNIPNPNLFGAVTLQLRKIRNLVPPDEFVDELRTAANESADLFNDNQSTLNAEVIELLNNSRVLCVTEELDNVVMWTHYADEHKGIALRLNCIDEIDNTLLVARPVQYTNTFPIFSPLTEYIKHLTGESPIDFGKVIMDQAPYIKHENWAYEKEWRVHVSQHETPTTIGYNDWKENSRIFGAIYFGCRIEPQDIQSLVKVIEEKMPHIEIYQSKLKKDCFGMLYERLL